MAKGKKKPVASPSSAAPPSSLENSTTPPVGIKLLAHLVPCLPYFLLLQQPKLLYPLFSSSNVHTHPLAPYLLLLPLLVLLPALVLAPRLVKGIGWRTWWVVMGLSFIVSDATVRLGARRFTSRGLDQGVLFARLATEGFSSVALVGWAMGSLFWCKERPTLAGNFALPWALVGGAALAGLPRVALFPECWTLQLGGLALVLTALSTSCASTFLYSHPHSFTERTRVVLLALTVTLLYSTSFLSPHCPLSTLSGTTLSTLTTPTTRILASRKGPTGWIVVGEKESKGMSFRYLRADHSLLGGLWVGHSRKVLEAEGELVTEEEVVQRAESIYKPKSALIIGLGTGLSARALAQHGVNVTINEIDPVVYGFARDWFGVDEPSGGVVLEDARTYLARRDERAKKYDYIIHDVFTGGTVPSHLFTLESWSLVRNALQPETGVLAVNFAGNVSSSAATSVLSTLLASFPYCRAIEDAPASSDPAEKRDYKNLVVFCSPSSSQPISFRKPVASDYLPYPSPMLRHRTFANFEEFELDLELYRGEGSSEWLLEGEKGEKRLETEQREGGRQHWQLMQDVIGDEVWSRW